MLEMRKWSCSSSTWCCLNIFWQVLGNHELNILRGKRKHGNRWYASIIGKFFLSNTICYASPQQLCVKIYIVSAHWTISNNDLQVLRSAGGDTKRPWRCILSGWPWHMRHPILCHLAYVHLVNEFLGAYVCLRILNVPLMFGMSFCISLWRVRKVTDLCVARGLTNF